MRFISGFSNITTGAEDGSLMSATHDVPDSVSKEKGPDFSILNSACIGFEIAHLFLRFSFLLLYMQYVQIAMARTRNADAHDKDKTRSLGFDLRFFFARCSGRGL